MFGIQGRFGREGVCVFCKIVVIHICILQHDTVMAHPVEDPGDIIEFEGKYAKSGTSQFTFFIFPKQRFWPVYPTHQHQYLGTAIGTLVMDYTNSLSMSKGEEGAVIMPIIGSGEVEIDCRAKVKVYVDDGMHRQKC